MATVDQLERRLAQLEHNLASLMRSVGSLVEITAHLSEEHELADGWRSDREWRGFLDEHRELKIVWREPDGATHLAGDYFWTGHDKTRLLDALRAALNGRPEGVTAREILTHRWGPDADLYDTPAVGSALYALSMRGDVLCIPGRPNRWTLPKRGAFAGLGDRPLFPPLSYRSGGGSGSRREPASSSVS